MNRLIFNSMIAESQKAVYNAGYEAGYEAGRKSEYDVLWDNLQQKGNRKHYVSAFCYSGWNDKNYNPKYPITPQNTNGIGGIFNWNQEITDTKVAITALGNCSNAFSKCVKLKRIPKIIFNGATNVNNMFQDCESLEEINVDGEIPLSINFQWSTKLTHDSIVSIINALSNNTSGLTLTLSEIAVNNAFETSEGAADGSTSTEWLALADAKTNWNIELV